MIRAVSVFSRGGAKNCTRRAVAVLCRCVVCCHNLRMMGAFQDGSHTRRDLLRWVAAWPVAVAVVGCGSPVIRAPVPPSQAEPDAAQRLRDEQVAPEQAQAVAMHAMGLVGTPYRFGGNTPDSGFDCSGLIGYVFQHAAGMRAPRTVTDISMWGLPVERDSVRSGDLAVFTLKGRTTHAGIYIGNGRFVHAPSSGGTVRLDRLDRGYWAAQGLQFRRAV